MRCLALLLVFAALVCMLFPGVYAQDRETRKEPEEGGAVETDEPKEGAAIRVQKMEPFQYCALEMTGSYDQHAAAFQELYAEAGKQGLDVTAAPFGIYWNDPQENSVEDLLWEIGLPIPAGKKIEKPLKVKEWEYEMVVSKKYDGSFTEEKMAAVYGEIYEWIDSNGYVMVGPVMEKFMSMPVLDESGEMSGAVEILVPVETMEE